MEHYLLEMLIIHGNFIYSRCIDGIFFVYYRKIMNNFFVDACFQIFICFPMTLLCLTRHFSYCSFDSRYILILEMVMSLFYYVLPVQWLSFLDIRQFIRYGWFPQISDVGSIQSVTIHVVMLTVPYLK